MLLLRSMTQLRARTFPIFLHGIEWKTRTRLYVDWYFLIPVGPCPATATLVDQSQSLDSALFDVVGAKAIRPASNSLER
jgi:hypothetical protein